MQVEINNKIDAMVLDGTFNDIVIPELTPVITSWLNDHISNPSNPPIDTSLSVAGAAADAKATGDVFSDLYNILDIQNHGITTETPFTATIGYVSKNGSINPNASYCYTPKISVNPGEIISVWAEGVERSCRFVCAYNGDTAIEASGAENVFSFTVPDGIDGIILTTGYSSGYTYSYKKTVLYPESDRILKIENSVKNKLNFVKSLTNFITTGSQSLKKNGVMKYYGIFTSFTELNIGLTGSNDYANDYRWYFNITPTVLTLYRKNCIKTRVEM